MVSIEFSYQFFNFITVIIYLLKSTEQEDVHMINTRTRAGQERHRKLALTFFPIKKNKKNKHTRYKSKVPQRRDTDEQASRGLQAAILNTRTLTNDIALYAYAQIRNFF